MPRKLPPLGPSSRSERLAKLDRRTRHGRHVLAVRAELTEHCGGKPSVIQRGLIERAAWLSLHLSMIDGRTVEGRGMTEHDAKAYIAWSNAYARTLAKIGLKPGAALPTRTLAEHLAERAAASAA